MKLYSKQMVYRSYFYYIKLNYRESQNRHKNLCCKPSVLRHRIFISYNANCSVLKRTSVQPNMRLLSSTYVLLILILANSKQHILTCFWPAMFQKSYLIHCRLCIKNYYQQEDLIRNMFQNTVCPQQHSIFIYEFYLSLKVSVNDYKQSINRM